MPCIAEAPFIPGAKNQIINLGATQPYSLNQLAKEVKKAMNSNVDIVHLPPRHEVKHAYCTTAKSEEILGYRDTVSLTDGLERMAAWAKRVGPMDPIVWEGFEVTKNMPGFWLELKDEFPNSKKRVNISRYH